MNNRQLRLILTLALLAFIVTALVLLMRPKREAEATPKREPQHTQTPTQEKLASQEQELPSKYQAREETREEPKPAQLRQTRHEPSQEQTPQVQPTPEETPVPPPHTRVVTDISVLGAQLRDYRTNTGAVPSTAQGLGSLGATLPKDPWDRDYIYQSPSTRGREWYDLFSAGPDGLPDTPDDDWGDDSDMGEAPQE